MKKTILYLAVSGFLASHLFAQSGIKEVVNQRIANYAQSKNDRKPVFYPELAERMEGLFLRYPVTHIVISGSGGAKKGKTDIYINGEDIYVIQGVDGWNLAANRQGIFEWETGKTNGIKLKRSDEDLVSYLFYLTDPSWIMASLYYTYLTSSNEFTVVPNKKKKWTELRLKTPKEGFEAIYVSEKPLWFYGFRLKNIESKRTAEITISEPKEMKELPEDLARQIKGVKFEDSNLSLQRHMTFL
jgi:hypothetical protein